MLYILDCLEFVKKCSLKFIIIFLSLIVLQSSTYAKFPKAQGEIWLDHAISCVLSKSHVLYEDGSSLKEKESFDCQLTVGDKSPVLYSLVDMPKELSKRFHEFPSHRLLLTLEYIWLNKNAATLRFDAHSSWRLSRDSRDSLGLKPRVTSTGMAGMVSQYYSSQNPERRHYLAIIVRTKSDRNAAVTRQRVIKKLSRQDSNHADGLREQYLACSNGQLEFVPYGNNQGVIEIDLPIDSSLETVNQAMVRNSALNQVRNKLSHSYDTIKHFLVIVPKDSIRNNLVAAASTGGRESTFHPDWFFDQNALMHEIGHNLGLGHAFDKNGVNFSFSGLDYMGATGWTPVEKKSKCFNAANMAKLKWFRDSSLILPNQISSITYTLSGIVSANSGSLNPGYHFIDLGRSHKDKENYYLSFNEVRDFNQHSESRSRNKLYLVRTDSKNNRIIYPETQPVLGRSVRLESFFSGSDLEIHYKNNHFDDSGATVIINKKKRANKSPDIPNTQHQTNNNTACNQKRSHQLQVGECTKYIVSSRYRGVLDKITRDTMAGHNKKFTGYCQSSNQTKTVVIESSAWSWKIESKLGKACLNQPWRGW